MLFTLVRHNMWMVPQFPQFIRGLQPLPVPGPRTAALIAGHGGVLLHSEGEAWESAEGFMYPAGDTTRPANPAGYFEDVWFLKLPLFVPEVSEDLLAV